MSVRTDVINLTVNVNGNNAQNNLNELRKKAADVKFEMEALKKGTQEYINKKAELKLLTDQMGELKKSIGLTSLSQKELVQELNKLKALRGSVIPFSDEYKTLSKSIKETENRLYDVKNGVQGFASVFSKVKDEVKQFGVAAAAYLGFEFLSSQFQNILTGAGKLSDQLADLRRVAGLTAGEAKELNSSLSKIDTRTSVSSLRDIAVVAGKLGVAKEDILSFTKAVDMLVVSLGDELGDAEAITSGLGKILNVFDGKITGDSITKLGNAFVQLANTGSATGGFIADFDQRLSGIAKSAGISLGALSGLGAGLEEMGGRVESSATAIQKLIISIATDLPAAAKIAGISSQEFEKLFKLDPTEALLKYSEGLVKNKKSFAEVTASFKDAGEEGARTIETITKLGTGADQLRKRIDLGKESIQESSAITEAFALKNETLGATLDKLGKEFNRLVTSSAVINFLKSMVTGFGEFLSILSAVPKFISDNSAAIKLLALGILLLNGAYIKSSAIIIYNSAAKLFNTNASKLSALATYISITAQSAYITVTNLLTGRITLATAAQRLWNIALYGGTGPLGILLIAIAAGVALFTALSKSINTSTAASRLNAEVQKRVVESTTEELNKVKLLKEVITDSNVAYDNKKKALEALIAINPQYLDGLTLENIKTEEGKKILDKYISSLQLKAELEAKSALLTDKLKTRDSAAATLKSLPSFAYYDDAMIEKFFRDADKQSKGNKLFGMGPDAKFEGINIPEIVKNYEQIKILQTDLSKAAKKNVEDVLGTTSTSAAASMGLIKKLQDAIAALDKARPDLPTKKAISENLAQRKKLQDELDALEGKVSNTDKKDEDLLGQAKAFRKRIDELTFQSLQASKSADQKEIDSVKHKFAEILKEYDIPLEKINCKGQRNNWSQVFNIHCCSKKNLMSFLRNKQKRILQNHIRNALKLLSYFMKRKKMLRQKGLLQKRYPKKFTMLTLLTLRQKVKLLSLKLPNSLPKKQLP